MKKLKNITRKDPFWKTLVHECDKVFLEYCTISGQSIDEDYQIFKQKLTEAVTSSMTRTKPHRKLLISRIQSKPERNELRKKRCLTN